MGWGERQEGGSGERGHFCIPVADSMYGRNQHNIVKQLSCNFLKKGKRERDFGENLFGRAVVCLVHEPVQDVGELVSTPTAH